MASTVVCVLCFVAAGTEVAGRRGPEVPKSGAAGSVRDLGGHAVSSAQ